jgi:rRNA-processing protein FCF1
MRMLLDTSFLITAMKGKMDILDELRKFGKPTLNVLDLVVKELESFSGGGSRRAIDSRLSLKFIEDSDIHVIKTRGGHTDNKIITYATNRKMVVCTMDKKLKETLLRRGAKVITIRQGKYLVLAFGHE